MSHNLIKQLEKVKKRMRDGTPGHRERMQIALMIEFAIIELKDAGKKVELISVLENRLELGEMHVEFLLRKWTARSTHHNDVRSVKEAEQWLEDVI